MTSKLPLLIQLIVYLLGLVWLVRRHRRRARRSELQFEREVLRHRGAHHTCGALVVHALGDCEPSNRGSAMSHMHESEFEVQDALREGSGLHE